MKKSLIVYLVFQLVFGLLGVILLVVASVSTMQPKCTCGDGVNAENAKSCDKLKDKGLKACCEHYKNIVWVSACPTGNVTSCGDLTCFKQVSRKGSLGIYIGVGVTFILVPAIVFWATKAIRKKKEGHKALKANMGQSSTQLPPARTSVTRPSM